MPFKASRNGGLRRPPKAYKAAGALLRRQAVKAWRENDYNSVRAAKQLGLDESSIRRYLNEAREDWKRDTQLDYSAAVEIQLAILARVETEAWAAYEGWKLDPDPRILGWKFLEIVQSVVRDRRELLGLDQPVKVDVTWFVGDPDFYVHGPKQTMEEAEAELRELLGARDPIEAMKRVRQPLALKGGNSDEVVDSPGPRASTVSGYGGV
jgi:hypothetical protein